MTEWQSSSVIAGFNPNSWSHTNRFGIFFTIKVNINMVYDTKTLVVLHQLTPDGEKRYRQFLEDEGTRILYRA